MSYKIHTNWKRFEMGIDLFEIDIKLRFVMKAPALDRHCFAGDAEKRLRR